jgi:DNA-binding winged helix-turn-helix (wHTH) protein
VAKVAASLAAAARHCKARCAGLAAAPSLRSGSVPGAPLPARLGDFHHEPKEADMDPASEHNNELRQLCPGRFTRVSLQTKSGEVEARLSEAGNWELRIRREEDTGWRLACSGDLDSGAVTREPVGPSLGEETRRLGPLEIEPAARRASVNGSALTLSKKEFGLLLVLASAPERVFSKSELLRAIWGEGNVRRTRTLDSHASRLRSKLRAAGAEAMVINCWGVGYRLWDRSDLTTFPPLSPVGEAA